MLGPIWARVACASFRSCLRSCLSGSDRWIALLHAQRFWRLATAHVRALRTRLVGGYHASKCVSDVVPRHAAVGGMRSSALGCLWSRHTVATQDGACRQDDHTSWIVGDKRRRVYGDVLSLGPVAVLNDRHS